MVINTVNPRTLEVETGGLKVQGKCLTQKEEEANTEMERERKKKEYIGFVLRNPIQS